MNWSAASISPFSMLRLVALSLLGLYADDSPAAQSKPLGPGRIVTRYSLMSSYDVARSDPTAWRLLASNDDGQSWTLLDRRTNQAFAARSQLRNYAISNRTSYSTYRLQIDAGTSSGSDPDTWEASIQLAEIEFLGPVTGVNNENELQSIITSSEAHPLMGPPEYAFDHDVLTRWYDFGLRHSTNCWIQCQYVRHAELLITNISELQILNRVVGKKDLFRERGARLLASLRETPTATVNTLTGYALTSANDSPGRDPRDWQLLGSRDGGKNWEKLDERHNESFSRRFQRRVFNLSTPSTCSYYRLQINSVRAESNLVQLAEVEPLYAKNSSPRPLTLVVSAKTDNPPMESLEMAFDGDPQTKWLSFESTHAGSPNWIAWQRVNGDAELPVVNRRAIDTLADQLLLSNVTAQTQWPLRTIKGYSLISANDHPERDPKAWRLRGSRDGGQTWTTLDERNQQQFFARGQKRNFTLNKEWTGSQFRFETLSVTDPQTANSVQLAEFEPVFAASDAPRAYSVIVSAQGQNPPREGCENLFDNDPRSKWLDFADTNPRRGSWFEWHYASPLALPVINLNQLSLAQSYSSPDMKIRLEGVALNWNPNSRELDFLDENGFQKFELESVDLSPGKPGRIRLAGTPQIGHDLPRISSATVVDLGPLRESEEVQPDQTLDDNAGFSLCQVQGSVAGISTSRLYTTITLDAAINSGRLLVRIVDPAISAVRLPLNCRLQIRGVLQPVWRESGTHVAGILWVSHVRDMSLANPTEKEWQNARLFQLRNLWQTNLTSSSLTRIRGRVIQQKPGENLTITDGTNSLVAHSSQNVPVDLGADVEVIGALVKHDKTPALCMALFRPIDPLAHEPARPNSVREAAKSNVETGPVTQIRQIRERLNSQPDKSFPVHLRGVVTFVELGPGKFYLHDGAESIVISAQFSAGLSGDLQNEGTYVEFSGVAERGRVYPTGFVKNLGRSRMPEPRRHSWDYLLTGRDDNQWVEVEGVVKVVDKQGLILNVDGGQLACRVRDLGPSAPDTLLGSLVRMTGVCAPVLNNRNQRLGLNLLVPLSECIQILRPAPENPFDLRTSPIPAILQADSETGIQANRITKIAGVVTYAGPQMLFIQEGADGLRVLPRQPATVAPGERVEAVGLVEPDGLSPKLVQAQVRKIGQGALSVPRIIESFGSGDDELEERLDDTRVQTEGILIGSSSKDGQSVLELQQEKTKRTFYAFVPSGDPGRQNVRPGSRLRLAGVFKCRTDAIPEVARGVTSFEMYLNSAADLTVLENATWWTARHTYRMLGGLALVLLLSLAWVRSLHRQVRQRTSELNETIKEHKDTAQALATSECFMRSLVESLPQNIVRKDIDGRFTFVNELFCRTLGKPKVEIIGRTDFDLFPKEMAEKFRRDDEQVIRSGKLLETVEQNQNATGDVIQVQVIKTPLYDAENQPAGLQLIFWDVTEKKRAEAQLEAAQKQLVETSRQAGMAEVATSVLHNVGNVLNSVNVSTTLLADNLKRSKLRNLSRAVDLIQEHQEDLGSFLTLDPKGKQIPFYLAQLATHLMTEQDTALMETQNLAKSVEHIKDIVTMQQSYAKVSGVAEPVEINRLIEDALRINAESLKRHNIQLAVECAAPLPQIIVDKHKVLQILINLIRNAEYACSDSSLPDKKLTFRLANGQNRIKICLSDNGIGIPSENLTRIFSHGFSTRKNGHGFGLHSGALAAKEMGGTLKAFSEGEGKGATFTLELPVSPNRSNPHS